MKWNRKKGLALAALLMAFSLGSREFRLKQQKTIGLELERIRP